MANIKQISYVQELTLEGSATLSLLLPSALYATLENSPDVYHQPILLYLFCFLITYKTS
jgi:hypothetical protein